MDLQAIRYAAMVSSMEFAEVVGAYEAHLERLGAREVDARAEVEGFLNVSGGDEEPVISSDVRIILVSADFGREITTTVLWLNGVHGMDIRCVRLVPYEIGGKVLLDIQQVLPLPEAADYQVRLRRKDAARERARTDGRDFTRYHIVVEGEVLPDQNKRNAIRVMVEQLAARGVPLSAIRDVLPDRMMRVLPGRLVEDSAVREALAAVDPKADVPRFFTDHPLIDESGDETYVLSRMWGRNTEPTLAALAAAFPQTKVTFQKADAPD